MFVGGKERPLQASDASTQLPAAFVRLRPLLLLSFSLRLLLLHLSCVGLELCQLLRLCCRRRVRN